MNMQGKISRPSPWPPETRLKAAAGFTLTEILVSLLVLVVGCLGVISLQISGMNAGDQAANLSVATFLAESQVEWLNTMTVDKVNSSTHGPEKLTQDGSACPDPPDGVKCFTRTTKAVCFTPTTRSCEISVSVEWQGTDRQHVLSYDTIVSASGF